MSKEQLLQAVLALAEEDRWEFYEALHASLPWEEPAPEDDEMAEIDRELEATMRNGRS